MEYILIPHNDDVTKPRALNTFLDCLAELGVDKRLIKNKKILSDLLEKKKAYRENENEADDDNDNNDNSDQEETASDQSQSESIDVESDSEPHHEQVIQKKKKSSGPCHHCQNWNVFASAVVKCPSCFWHDNYSICPICCHEIPVDAEHVKESFAR